MRKLFLLFSCAFCLIVNAQEETVVINFDPFIWKSEKPKDCPFEDSKAINGIKFLGIKSGFFYGDTWYPSWASDDKLYSPWTDGNTKGIESFSSGYTWDGQIDDKGVLTRKATTGQAIISGDDPLTIAVDVLGLSQADPYPYGGRYPCGSLVYNGVWYYGTYCLSPFAQTRYGDTAYNWPFLGPFVGFRYSTDYGKTWIETTHTASSPIFGENGMGGHPVRIGSPHFVDFGRNMEYSPDGKAYMVAHGSDQSGCGHTIYHNSWITGDQIYLLRVTPGIDKMNDPSRYEFFAGNDNSGNPVWTNDFKKIKPLLEWNENMGCVTVTYNAPLKKYFMCVTDGGNTCARMHTYILESDHLTGEWKLVTYMKNFGEQGYFVNFPSKFISDDGKTAWLLYSGNFAPDWNNEKINENPPGSHYGMVLQKVEFLFK
jgi:hypothetical protein